MNQDDMTLTAEQRIAKRNAISAARAEAGRKGGNSKREAVRTNYERKQRGKAWDQEFLPYLTDLLKLEPRPEPIYYEQAYVRAYGPFAEIIWRAEDTPGGDVIRTGLEILRGIAWQQQPVAVTGDDWEWELENDRYESFENQKYFGPAYPDAAVHEMQYQVHHFPQKPEVIEFYKQVLTVYCPWADRQPSSARLEWTNDFQADLRRLNKGEDLYDGPEPEPKQFEEIQDRRASTTNAGFDSNLYALPVGGATFEPTTIDADERQVLAQIRARQQVQQERDLPPAALQYLRG